MEKLKNLSAFPNSLTCSAYLNTWTKWTTEWNACFRCCNFVVFGQSGGNDSLSVSVDVLMMHGCHKVWGGMYWDGDGCVFEGVKMDEQVFNKWQFIC